jgi:tetratricopeptide (TPR) repeat protein
VSGTTLERRLANYRAAIRPEVRSEQDRTRSSTLAMSMAEAVDGEIVGSDRGAVVRCEPLTVVLPLDRERLARLPGQPPPGAPLVCIDTETTGLATAAGTMAFLVGLGWWEGDRFRQAQLLLPDQPNEPAMLALLETHIPRDAWLVSYNGKGFDWPLLVTRYRMARRDPPVHAGHLDLLPFVRRVFRHRMVDARLRTVESALLGVIRNEDVDGWEIPGRYLDFLRSGLAEPLIAVVRHNREDVRSLARLLGHIEQGFAGAADRAAAHRGDLAGLARSFSRERRLDEALDCVETAIAAAPPPVADPVAQAPTARPGRPVLAAEDGDPWWSIRRRPDFGGRPGRPEPPLATRLDSPWTEERIRVERARLLRRLGRYEDAAAAWQGLAAGSGSLAAHAWIEVAKLLEHRLGDAPGALAASRRAAELADRRRRSGFVDPGFDRALAVRLGRLTRRAVGRSVAPAQDVSPLVDSGWAGGSSATVRR